MAALPVAFYNASVTQPQLDTASRMRAENTCWRLARDIAEGFRRHRLDLLCLCELGEHEIGLQGRNNLGCQSQHELLQLIVGMANEDLQGGAPEPAVQVELVSGQHPAYAAVTRRGSRLLVDNILFHRGLDTIPGIRVGRTMLTLNCRWMDEQVNITNCHCPSSKKGRWDQAARMPCCLMCSDLLAWCRSMTGAAAL